MTGIIIQNTLRSNWKPALYWGSGMGVLGFYVVAIASSSDILASYGGLLEAMPPAMLSLIGVSDVSLLTTAEGFITSLFVAYAMLILSVYAVMAGLNITANEEDSGIMDIVLTLPVSRAQVLVEKFIAYALLSLGVIAFCIIFPLIGIILLNVEADISKVILSILNIYPALLLITAVTCLIGTSIRRRATIVGLSATFVVASYFINFLGDAASESFVATLQSFSIFYYTNGESIVLGTFNPLAPVILIVVALICVSLAVMMFNRRDVGL